ncbi:hypothetical protein [Vibrio sp. 1CM8B]|uniref:hypothetical protein n=1 Tax=Vibrio sp. 1CM8B TaxID=2929167 RepID=UPI0020BEEB98|nr:hypothetical protein [Vibrio sp. 1CM8B]MCK8084651.1 hypothetical protein [Vibrio sp. 1CM8B]
MKTLVLFLAILFIAPYAVSTGFDKKEVEHFNQMCVDGSYNHQRRIFDALSNSEYIDWSSIELIDTESRVNYTDTTVEIKQTDRVTCDLIVEYKYHHADIVLSSSYQVSLKDKQTISNVAVTEQAVTDFIVRVMVN